MARAKKTSVWSFVTGEKGRNRVRAFEHVSRGAIFLEFYDRTPIAGERVKQRVSVKHTDREKAKAQAEELAAKLRTAGFRKLTEPTLAELFDIYVREVTPAKESRSRSTIGARSRCSLRASAGTGSRPRSTGATGTGSYPNGGPARFARRESTSQSRSGTRSSPTTSSA
jgi:hypothetical protein